MFEQFLGNLAPSLPQFHTALIITRLTLVKDFNAEEVDGYKELIKRGQPDFIEVKASVPYFKTSFMSHYFT